MKREILITTDGSTTIHLPDWNESYHSKHGAIQEAYHVFIKNGLDTISKTDLSILEIGFGTGLNAFITFLETTKRPLNITYVGVEAYPISLEEIEAMNYVNELNSIDYHDTFKLLHEFNWERKFELNNSFSITKRKQFFQEITDENTFDLIYFDAFGFRVQPELWSLEIFQSMFKALKNEGVLVTYAARGVIKRNMIAAGFEVEKLAGPPGKREMFRAIKKKI